MDSTQLVVPKSRKGRRETGSRSRQVHKTMPNKRLKLENDDGVKNLMTLHTKLQYLWDYCRVCACTSESLIPIYEEPGIEIQLEEKINKYLPITVSENDALPLKVCQTCIDKIEITHELILSSLDSDSTFKYVQNQNSSQQDEASESPTKNRNTEGE